MTHPRPLQLALIVVLLGVLAAILILIIDPGLNRPAPCGSVPSTEHRSTP